MFDIYGVPPFGTQEQKITSRVTKEVATEYAHNLAAFGYKNIRVTDGGPTPAVAAEPPAASAGQ